MIEHARVSSQIQSLDQTPLPSRATAAGGDLDDSGEYKR